MDPAPVPESLGDFLIEAVLGQGGSGIVYDATWGPRRVALKVLHRDLVGTGKERAQFIAEAERLKGIAHPSVVKVLAVGELPDGRPYLAMERLDGDTLASLIAKGPLSVEHSLHLFGEMCNAVSALHEQGLVHRDLKPENVFIVGGKHAVLLDFGIAKELDAPASTTTQEGAVRGTPAYMAPERFFGQPASVATDLYELAVILYAMLAGRLPWDNLADPEARLSPRALVDHAHVPEALDVEVRRALSTRAQNRPSSASALLEVVRAATIDGASAPGPAATARMRPATAPPPITHAPSEPPARSLALAPTVAATSASSLGSAPTVATTPGATVRTRKRWPYVAFAIALVGVAGGLVAWEVRAGAKTAVASAKAVIERTGSASGFAANDPWGAPAPEPPLPVLPLIEPSLTAETYRAEAAAAIQRMPADTKMIVTAQIGELRAQPQTAHLLETAGRQPIFVMFSRVFPPCVRSLIAQSEWVVYGSASLASRAHGTVVTRGRWQRSDVEKCFGDTVAAQQLQDGPRIFKLQNFGWLDFIDDHTAYLTNRADLGAEAVHALVVHGAGPQGRTRDLVLDLPTDRSITIVVTGGPKDDWNTPWLANGSDVYSWVRVQADGLILEFVADTHSDAAARVAETALRKTMIDMFGSSTPTGKLEVIRQRTVVHLKGTMTLFMLGLLDMAISAV
ncbi:MAG: hypothetical protein JWO36_1616 [Myxococcales bacterium]|nr:hypothetical protein [Myxococcales bacterium]